MPSKNLNDLVFSNGRSVKRLKQDAKKLAKEKNLPLNQALNQIAINTAGFACWEDAIKSLKHSDKLRLRSKVVSDTPKRSKLAEQLGISDEELEQLEWEADINESSDGHPNSYILSFYESSPRQVLNKIEGLTEFGEVEVSLNAYDTYQADDPENGVPSVPSNKIPDHILANFSLDRIDRTIPPFSIRAQTTDNETSVVQSFTVLTRGGAASLSINWPSKDKPTNREAIYIDLIKKNIGEQLQELSRNPQNDHHDSKVAIEVKLDHIHSHSDRLPSLKTKLQRPIGEDNLKSVLWKLSHTTLTLINKAGTQLELKLIEKAYIIGTTGIIQIKQNIFR